MQKTKAINEALETEIKALSQAYTKGYVTEDQFIDLNNILKKLGGNILDFMFILNKYLTDKKVDTKKIKHPDIFKIVLGLMLKMKNEGKIII